MNQQSRRKSLPKQSDVGSHRDLNGNAFVLPTFSMRDVRDAIPPHSFQPDTIMSFSYILRDLFLIGSTAYAATYIHFAPYPYLRGLLWVIYSFLQGLFGTGLWILAHECGHGAFTRHKRLQDFTGWVLHSALLSPFFSWKITHRKHHASTGNVDKDNAFVPKSRETWTNLRFSWYKRFLGEFDVHKQAFSHLTEDTPLRMLWHLGVHKSLDGRSTFSRMPQVGWTRSTMCPTTKSLTFPLVPTVASSPQMPGGWSCCRILE